MAHTAYWARGGGGAYGPRYYSEAMPFLWIVAARGLIKFGSTIGRRRLVKAALPLMIGGGVLLSMIPRFIEGYGLYDITRRDTNVIAAAGLHHALVFVQSDYWTEYANLSWLNQPNPGGDIIFAQDGGPSANRQVIQDYPGRAVYLYNRDLAQPLSVYSP